jgi:DNA-binding NarL/FixJ family response regulator
MIIRCVLVDDHTLIREGVQRLLEAESGLAVVGEASGAAEALELVRQVTPDIVLMDIGMPGMSAFEAARLIVRDFPRTRVIFLTMHEDEEYLLKCLEVGASGYVLKDSSGSRLISAVREVHAGGKYLSPRVMRRLVANFSAPGDVPRSRGAVLTPREHEVVKLLAEGNSVRKVADLLGVSSKTVEAHKFNLMRKLDIHNKAQLVTYAIQKKIVKVPAGY